MNSSLSSPGQFSVATENDNVLYINLNIIFGYVHIVDTDDISLDHLYETLVPEEYLYKELNYDDTLHGYVFYLPENVRSIQMGHVNQYLCQSTSHIRINTNMEQEFGPVQCIIINF